MEFETYIKVIRSLILKNDTFHWRASSKANHKKGLRILTNFYKEYGLMDDRQELVRVCGQKTCLNPLHYTVKDKCKIPEGIDMDEVEALEPMIDLDELELRGFNEYLRTFNLTNALPARDIDFFVACNRKLKKKGKETLDIGLLDDF